MYLSFLIRNAIGDICPQVPPIYKIFVLQERKLFIKFKKIKAQEHN